MTLNFIRSLSAGGFADVHHPEYWELSFFRRAGVARLAPRVEYERTTRQLAEALRFMEALGESTRRGADAGRLLHEPRGAEPALRVGADPPGPAPRRLVRSDHPLPLDWRANARARRRARRVLPRHREPGRHQARAERHRRSGARACSTRSTRTNEPGKIALVTRMGATQGGRRAPRARRRRQARRAHRCSGSATRCTATPRSLHRA